MKIDILTLFPEMFDAVFGSSIIKNAIEKNAVEINAIDIRSFSTDKHHKVDDLPYGGGSGMVIYAEPVIAAINEHRTKTSQVILLCPRGKRLKQSTVMNMAEKTKHIILVCGHYEGFDERIMPQIDQTISVGDFVLTGGELPAMIVVDALVRTLPGVIGSESSYQNDSFFENLLDYPAYTRPAELGEMKVPGVLLSGHHERIDKYRQKQAISGTFLKRPDILSSRGLTQEEQVIFKEYLKEE